MKTRGKMLARVGGLLLGSAVGGLLFWHVTRGLDFSHLTEHGSEIRPGYVCLALLLASGLLWLSAGEWKLFLSASDQLPVGRLYRIVAMMSLLQNVVHHFAGQAYALYQLVRVERLSPAAAASIIALDQVAEGFAKLGLIAPLAFYVAIPGPIGVAVGLLAAGVLLLYCALLFVASAARRSDPAALGSATSGPAWRRNVAAWSRQLAAVMSPRRMLCATLLAFGKKLLRAAALLCIQSSLSISLAWYMPLMVVGAIDVATLIPVAPGHLGIFEAVVCLVYATKSVDPERALLAALLFHGVSLSATVAPGLVLMCLKALRLPERAIREPVADRLAGELPGLETALPGPSG